MVERGLAQNFREVAWWTGAALHEPAVAVSREKGVVSSGRKGYI